jgi:membrane-associated protein
MDWVQAYVVDLGWLAYLVFAGLLFAETGLLIGFVVPAGDTLLITLGMLAATGTLRLEYLIPSMYVAAVAGHSVGYWLGHALGPAVKSKVPAMYYQKAERAYQKYGVLVMLVAPLITGVRTVIPFMFGAMHVPFVQFFALSLVGSAIWTVGITLLGFFLGELIPKWAVYAVIFAIVGFIVLPDVYKNVRAYLEAKKAKGREQRAEG